MRKLGFFILVLCTITALLISPFATLALERTQSVYSVNIVMDLDGDAVNGEIIEICQLKDGSIVGIGSTGEHNSSNYADRRTEGDLDSSAIVVKYNSNGKIAFVKTFGGNGPDRFNNVIATSDGGFIATGYSGSFDGGDFRLYNMKRPENDAYAFMVKYDKNGNVSWAISAYDAQMNHFVNIIEETNNDICVVGYSINKNNTTTYYSFRLNSSGNFVYPYKEITAENALAIYDFLYSADRSLYICGLDKNEDSFFSKYTPNGDLVYTKTFSTDGFEGYSGMIFTSDGCILLKGSFKFSTKGEGFKSLGKNVPGDKQNSGYMVVKYTTEGQLVGGDIIIVEENINYGRVGFNARK